MIKSNRYQLLLMLFVVSNLSACKGIGVAEVDEGAIKSEDTTSSLVFAGISYLDQKTDSTLRLNWTPDADAVAYDVFNTTSGTSVWMVTVTGQASANFVLTGLTPNQLYKFRVKAKNSLGVNDTNIKDVSVTMNLAPDVPSALTLISSSNTPVIRVDGVKNGNVIKLFTNSSCTAQVASGIASGTTIDLMTSPLVAGAYNFYTTASNSTSSSSCSSANLAYILCPTGYFLVAGNATLGTNEFCVMQFEAKSVAGVATSQAAEIPWGYVNQTDSKSACTALGAGYDLISNPEWMTIAYDIETTPSNWGSGVVGTGALYRGHSDTGSRLDVTDITDPYNGTGNTSAQLMGSGKEQRRTFTLSDGKVIWDFSGNVWEWVDWTVGGVLDSGPTSCTAAWTEFPDVSCGALLASDYLPRNPASITAANYNVNYGLGRLFGGTGGAPLRGGSFVSGVNAGAYSIAISTSPTSAYKDMTWGFRCVFRP